MSFTLKPPQLLQLLHLLQFSFRGTTGAPTISARQVLFHTLIAQSVGTTHSSFYNYYKKLPLLWNHNFPLLFKTHLVPFSNSDCAGTFAARTADRTGRDERESTAESLMPTSSSVRPELQSYEYFTTFSFLTDNRVFLQRCRKGEQTYAGARGGFTIVIPKLQMSDLTL